MTIYKRGDKIKFIDKFPYRCDKYAREFQGTEQVICDVRKDVMGDYQYAIEGDKENFYPSWLIDGYAGIEDYEMRVFSKDNQIIAQLIKDGNKIDEAIVRYSEGVTPKYDYGFNVAVNQLLNHRVLYLRFDDGAREKLGTSYELNTTDGDVPLLCGDYVRATKCTEVDNAQYTDTYECYLNYRTYDKIKGLIHDGYNVQILKDYDVLKLGDKNDSFEVVRSIDKNIKYI